LNEVILVIRQKAVAVGAWYWTEKCA